MKCWNRTSWRKRAVNKLLQLRRNDRANRDIDWIIAPNFLTRPGPSMPCFI